MWQFDFTIVPRLAIPQLSNHNPDAKLYFDRSVILRVGKLNLAIYYSNHGMLLQIFASEIVSYYCKYSFLLLHLVVKTSILIDLFLQYLKQKKSSFYRRR